MKKDELILNNMNLIYFVLKNMNLYSRAEDYFDVRFDWID